MSSWVLVKPLNNDQMKHAKKAAVNLQHRCIRQRPSFKPSIGSPVSTPRSLIPNGRIRPKGLGESRGSRPEGNQFKFANFPGNPDPGPAQCRLWTSARYTRDLHIDRPQSTFRPAGRRSHGLTASRCEAALRPEERPNLRRMDAKQGSRRSGRAIASASNRVIPDNVSEDSHPPPSTPAKSC